jgi:hypothetical protein
MDSRHESTSGDYLNGVLHYENLWFNSRFEKHLEKTTNKIIGNGRFANECKKINQLDLSNSIQNQYR